MPYDYNASHPDEQDESREDVEMATAAQETTTTSPASERPIRVPGSRVKGKPSPLEAAGSRHMPPPPPVSKRPKTYGERMQAAATASSSASASTSTLPMDATTNMKRLQKKLREIERLEEQQRSGRTLNHEEQIKVAQKPAVDSQLTLLLRQQPPVTSSGPTPVATPVQQRSTPLSAASTMPASCAAAACNAAHATLSHLATSPPTRASTRATTDEVRQQMAAERAALEAARIAAREAAQKAETELWLIIRAPLDSWDDAAIWQLAVCEFALEHLDDVASLAKELQLEFQDACLLVRNPLEVPRLRGSLRIDALQDALANSEPLKLELERQLGVFKRIYCSLLSGFGRFRRVSLQPGESLLGLMQRTHGDALKWRPPGPTPAEQLALQSKEGTRYIAEWRDDTYEQRHFDTGRTLSLRGTVGCTKAGLRRLKKLPDGQKPKIEHFVTVRRHDYQAHHIQRNKSLTNSFAVQRCLLQWDEVTMNKLAWTVIILNCMRTSTLREREVLSTTKLGAAELAKAGSSVATAIVTANEDFDTPVHNIDYCCTDTTSSNSSLNLPKEKGGSGGKGGAYAHVWHWFKTKGHILFFMLWCLSHLANNETKMVGYLALALALLDCASPAPLDGFSCASHA